MGAYTHIHTCAHTYKNTYIHTHTCTGSSFSLPPLQPVSARDSEKEKEKDNSQEWENQVLCMCEW